MCPIGSICLIIVSAFNLCEAELNEFHLGIFDITIP
jgi:hypothetical protein